MGNPLCPFCGRVLTSDSHQTYRAEGAILMMGVGKSWDCDWCGKFWWKGKSAIMRTTALSRDRKGVLAQVKLQISNYLRSFGIA